MMKLVKPGFGSVFEQGLLKEKELGFRVFDPPEGAPPFQDLRCLFKDGKWQEPRIATKSTLTISKAAGCLYYGHELYEGMAAHMTKNGRCLLFRPLAHANRCQNSSEILMMQKVPIPLFLEMVQEVVRLNAGYLPRYGTGARLYIRAYLLGINPQIALGPSDEYLFVVFAFPVGNYYPTGLKSMQLYCSPRFDRVAERGTGQAKVGGNYIASYPAKTAAKAKDCGEYLYLDAASRSRVLETGSANFVGLRADGIYVTPGEMETEVLISITNRSLQTIAHGPMNFKVEKRRLYLKELFYKGPRRFFEAFICGTAARLTPVKAVLYENRFGRNPRLATFSNVGEATGPRCHELYEHLVAIQHGDEEDRWNWTKEVRL